MCAKSQFERLVFSVAYAFILLLLIIIFSELPLTITVAYKEAYNSLDATTTFSTLIVCFGTEINPEKLKPCVGDLSEHIKVEVTDLITGKKYIASNAAFYEWHVEYWNEFDYPLKIGNEIHPAKVRIEFLKFTLLPG